MPVVNHPDQIAIVCDTVPYPSRSGDNQRITELIHVLRHQGWFVHLVLCGFLDGRQKRTCRAHVDDLHVYTGTGWKSRARNGLRRSVRSFDRVGKTIGLPPAEEIAAQVLGRSITPVVMNYWQRYPYGLDAFIAQLADSHSLKALIIEYIWLHPAAAKISHGIPCLLDTHDLQYKRVEEFASRGLAFPLRITRDQEADIFNRFDSVIAIQSQEAALIRSMCPNLNVLTVGSSGAPEGAASDSPIPGRVLYVGGYNGANIDGLRRFLDSAWPRIRIRCPQAHLRVCGYIYRAFLCAQFDGVEFIGHVENTEREYTEASVIINPSWIGTGLKIKTIEALARGKPLVTTSKGIEGLTPEVRLAAAVCDDDERFANQVIRILTNCEARREMSEVVRAFAARHLNQQSVYKELTNFLNELR